MGGQNAGQSPAYRLSRRPPASQRTLRFNPFAEKIASRSPPPRRVLRGSTAKNNARNQPQLRNNENRTMPQMFFENLKLFPQIR